MAKKLVEFVPNFSEGRDKEKVEKIVDEARKIKGLKILDYSSDADHNRSVVTIIGSPEAVTEAAINMAKVAIQLIDMRTHHGAHPRFGAVDVVPFTPVMGVTMDECVAIANAVGKAYGEMGIPVYLYEDACTKEARRNLAAVRKGQYEGFFEKIKDPEWKPDYGPAVMNEKSGCSAVGAQRQSGSRCHCPESPEHRRRSPLCKGHGRETGRTEPGTGFHELGELRKIRCVPGF